MELYDKVTQVLDDYGILYGDIVDNGDGSVNIVGIDEEEWDEVVDAIKAELGLDVIVPDSDHDELDNELIVRESLEEVKESKLNEGRYADLSSKLAKAKEELKELKVKLDNAPTEEARDELFGAINSKEIEIGDLEGALAEIRYIDNGSASDYSGYESLKESKEDKLIAMIKDDKVSIGDCMHEYLTIYEDTDVMTSFDMEETIRDLNKGNEEEVEQAKRLEKLLDDNPGVDYFDYYNEEPITDKKWLMDKLELKEALHEAKEEEPKLETFEDKMDFLAKDEQEAIDGYDKVIAMLDSEKDAFVIEQLTKIKIEEEAHKKYLEDVKTNKELEYTEPLEQEDKESAEIQPISKKFLDSIDDKKDESLNETEAPKYADDLEIEIANKLEKAFPQSKGVHDNSTDIVMDIVDYYQTYYDEGKTQDEIRAKLIARLPDYGVTHMGMAGRIIDLVIKEFGIDKWDWSEGHPTESLKEEQKGFVTFFNLECGVLLKEDHPEFKNYSVAYDHKHGYYDETYINDVDYDKHNLLNKEDKLELLKDAGMKYIKEGVNGTYAILTNIDVQGSLEDDFIQDAIKEVEEEGFISNSIEFLDNEQFKASNVIWSAYKDENGEIIENFVDTSVTEGCKKQLKEYNLPKDAKPYKTCGDKEYYIATFDDVDRSMMNNKATHTIVTKKVGGDFDLGSASGLDFDSEEKAKAWIDDACKNKEVKEDLTKFSSGMKVKIKGDKENKVYLITDISKEGGTELYNLVDASNPEGEILEEPYEFNELELVAREDLDPSISDKLYDLYNEGDIYFDLAKDKDGDDFLIVDGWEDVRKIQKALKPDFEPKDEYDTSVLDELFDNGYQWGFRDEYSKCDNCGNVIRTEADSYSWVPDFFVDYDNGEIICGDCVRENPKEYLETLYNNPEKANTILSAQDLIDNGFTKIDGNFEDGWYDKHDNPETILNKALEEHPNGVFIFHISGQGQFATQFELWGADLDLDESKKKDIKEEKECFFEIVFKEKDDEEEKTERYDDDFDGARKDYLFMTQDKKDEYQYVVLRKVCTDYNSEEDIEVIDSFGLDESLKENKNSNVFYVEIDDNQNNAQAIIKITSAKTKEEACKKAKRLFIKWEDIDSKTYREYDMEEFVIEPKYIDKKYIVVDETGEEVDNPNKDESLKESYKDNDLIEFPEESILSTMTFGDLVDMKIEQIYIGALDDIDDLESEYGKDTPELRDAILNIARQEAIDDIKFYNGHKAKKEAKR